MKRMGAMTCGLLMTGGLTLQACADLQDVAVEDPQLEDVQGVEELAAPLTQLATPCTFAAVSGVLTMTVTVADAETAVVSKRSVDSAILVNGTQCDTATATTVKRILINGSTGVNTVILDFINGSFAPGYGTTAGIVVGLLGGNDALKIRGSTAADTITFGVNGVGFNADTINDLTHTGVESFVVSASAGADIVSGSGGFGTGNAFTTALTIYGGDGNDTLSGGTAADTINGGEGDDTLRGASDAALDTAADTLNGDAGDDTFDAGNATNGADTFNGGADTDTVSYANRTVAVVVTIGAGSNDGQASETDTVAADVEAVTGGAGADTLTGSAAGDTLNGGAGNDTLTGGNGDDTLNGDAGDDTLVTGAADTDGADVYSGGAGIDVLTYAARSATVVVSLDNIANDGADTELDNAKNDIEDLIGGSGNDTFTGSSSDNVLTGGDGDDTLNGGAGNDTFDEGTADNGSDTFNGGAGTDLVDYSGRVAALTVTMDGAAADDGLSGEADDVGADVEDLIGGSDDDNITGNSLANDIDGGAGLDTIDGGAGNDTLFGAAGVDTISGGAGDDLLDGGAGADVLDCGAGDGDVVITDANDNPTVACEL